MTGTAEFDLLCLLARPQPDLGRAGEILRSGCLDAATVLRLAEAHGVRPHLIKGLAQLGWHGVPDSMRDGLQFFRRTHQARTLVLAEELCRVAETFSARGIPFVAFKGAALAVVLHGDVSAREYNDTDLLVPGDRLDDAERGLAELGYHGVQGDRAFRRAFLGHLGQFAFGREGLEDLIDLHWSFGGTHLPSPLAPEDVWPEREPVSVGRLAIPTLTGRNLALLLASHGTKESWRCLAWVIDFATVVDRARDLDWANIHDRAVARGCGNAVLLGCALAESLLGVAVPAALAPRLARNDHVRARLAALTAGLRGTLLAQQEHLADFDLWDRKSDRLRAALRLALTRSAGDYQAMPLPRALWGLYHLTRPFRLATKALGGRASISDTPKV